MTRRTVFLHAAAAAVWLVPLPARPQTTFAQEAEYEQRYGEPVDVSITDLELNPDAYIDRAVRAHGHLELDRGQRRAYLLRDSLGGSAVKIVPVPEISDSFMGHEQSMFGRGVEVTGVVKWMSNAGDTRRPGMARVQIVFWSFNADPARMEDAKKAVEVSLESLARAPGRRDGQLVRIVGQFRGSNLYGDLPNTSRRAGGDWVLKNDAFAVWVTGKKPKGDGFDLDRSSKVDTDKWVEVVGRPYSRAGVTWIQAVRVAMAAPPAPVAPAPAVAASQTPRVPATIVFAMPVDGDGEVAVDSRFTVQFSKDMDESSFKGRVVLRYAGPARPAAIATAKVVYDPGRRTLIVDPGTALAARRPLELLLLPGIVDSEGLALEPRVPPAADGVAEVLRYSTAG